MFLLLLALACHRNKDSEEIPEAPACPDNFSFPGHEGLEPENQELFSEMPGSFTKVSLHLHFFGDDEFITPPAIYSEGINDPETLMAEASIQLEALNRAFRPFNYYVDAMEDIPQTIHDGNCDVNTFWDQDWSLKNVSNALDLYFCFDNMASDEPSLGNAMVGSGMALIHRVGDNYTNDNDYVVAHEAGHGWGLFHTFETDYGFEHVNGDNSACAGDFITDTPADIEDGCDYEETSCPADVKLDGVCYDRTCPKDENGDKYKPDETNILSYNGSWMDSFTQGQIAVLSWFLGTQDY